MKFVIVSHSMTYVAPGARVNVKALRKYVVMNLLDGPLVPNATVVNKSVAPYPARSNHSECNRCIVIEKNSEGFKEWCLQLRGLDLLQ